MNSRCLPYSIVLTLVALLPIRAADPAALKFFEDKVRPVLATNCFKCHGAEKQKGDLRVDSRAALLRGGESGPALRPGEPEASLLIAAVRHGEALKMPPQKRLANAEIANLAAWVKMGAPWPDAAAAPLTMPAGPKLTLATFTEEQRRFWAFQKPVDAPLPAVRDGAWPHSPIDHFILAGLETRGLRPAPPADRRTLLRRVTFDLTGLPPTLDDTDAFLADARPDAFDRVVERLLASPAYGERWGRRWLDVARYADSNGMDENQAYGNAWRYRDYVIAALNADKPYDQFVREQLAGDLLPTDDPNERIGRIIATGFLTIGPKMLAEDDPVKMQMDIVDEQLDTVGQAFLGLTLGCARCHDHKFDPIDSADYYGLAGVFKSTRTMDTFTVVARWHERSIAPATDQARLAEHDGRIALKRAEINKPAPLAVLAAGSPGAGAARVRQLKGELKELEKARPVVPEAMAVEEGKPENVRVHLRGNHLTQGAEVPRRFPRILAGESQPGVQHGSGRRELADWLTKPDHPLTARVLVNRVWLGHFGEGLVRTPDNFGRLGERPSHPALLDWLAVRFVRDGWSLKALHQLIVRSAAYQMSTAHDDRAALADPDNRLLWRFNRRRLDAEELRDALLQLGGQLERGMGGTLFTGSNRAYVPGYPNSSYNGYDINRRTVYLPVIRSEVYNVLQTFDFADPSVVAGKRPATTVAPQALFMMNAKLVQDTTRRLAEALPPGDNVSRVQALYRRIAQRQAQPRELSRAMAFLDRYQRALEADGVARAEQRVKAWQALARVLVSSNEFAFVE